VSLGQSDELAAPLARFGSRRAGRSTSCWCPGSTRTSCPWSGPRAAPVICARFRTAARRGARRARHDRRPRARVALALAPRGGRDRARARARWGDGALGLAPHALGLHPRSHCGWRPVLDGAPRDASSAAELCATVGHREARVPLWSARLAEHRARRRALARRWSGAEGAGAAHASRARSRANAAAGRVCSAAVRRRI